MPMKTTQINTKILYSVTTALFALSSSLMSAGFLVAAT